ARADLWHLQEFTCHGLIASRGLSVGHVFGCVGVHLASISLEVLLRTPRRDGSRRAARRSVRHTTRSPDHTSSSAATLLSTRPSGRNTSRTTHSDMSVGSLLAFFGHATQRPPSTSSTSSSFGTRRSSATREVWNDTTTSAVPVARVRIVTSSGRPSSWWTNPAGDPSRTSTCPSLIPSFFASGVPEYPGRLGVEAAGITRS